MRALFTAILVLFGTLILDAQQLSAVLDKDTIFIGQPATIVFTFSIPQEETVSHIEWEIPSDSIAPGLEILSRTGESDNTSNTHTWSETIIFTASSTGYFPVAPVKVNFKGKAVESEAFLITAYSTIKNPEQEKLRDIKESSAIAYNWLDWLLDNWFIILIIIIVSSIIITVVKLFSPKKEMPLNTSELDKALEPTAYEIAQKKILELETTKFWKSGELKEFHTAISYLLREYIEGELDISALENTSGEINAALLKFNFPVEIQKQIRVSLSLTDLVKYAKQLPSDSENEKVLRDVKEVINFIYKSEGKPTDA